MFHIGNRNFADSHVILKNCKGTENRMSRDEHLVCDIRNPPSPLFPSIPLSLPVALDTSSTCILYEPSTVFPFPDFCRRTVLAISAGSIAYEGKEGQRGECRATYRRTRPQQALEVQHTCMYIKTLECPCASLCLNLPCLCILRKHKAW
jgi:hypothetical protein